LPLAGAVCQWVLTISEENRMGSASVERVWGFLPFYNNNMHNQTKRRENPDLPKNEDAVTPVGAAVA
jgi:hypothetical protein